MLQFFKKNKKDKTSQPHNANLNGVSSLPVGVTVPTFAESNSEGPLTNFQHDGYTDSPPPQRSRLSINLSETLRDRVALSYFSQFVETRSHATLLSLYLDIRELLSSPETSKSNVNGDGDACKTNNERTSVCGEVVTIKKVCQRYLSEDVIQRFLLPEETCVKIQASAASGSVNKTALQQLQEFACQVMKKEVWPEFVRSEFFSKLQVEVLTSGGVTLSDILYHPAALTSFSEFLEQEGCSCVIEFWREATLYQNQLRPDSDPDTAQTQAIDIYDKYLSLQASCPLGVDGVTRCEVEHRICVEDAAPRNDCLEPVLRKAWGYLRYVCLPLFLSSQSYVQLISELMRATRTDSSPASSVTDVSVESRASRYDPDLIWRRTHQRGLSIGRIDQLGRFETDIEPEPDKKSESKISRVVKKFVNKEEHKAQEEMAWRVAEMIVKDVTNLTMGGQTEDEEES